MRCVLGRRTNSPIDGCILFAGAFSLSFLVFLSFRKLNDLFGFSRSALCLWYCLPLAVLVVCSVWLWPDTPFSSAQHGLAAALSEALEKRIGWAMQHPSQSGAKKAAAIKKSVAAESTPLLVPVRVSSEELEAEEERQSVSSSSSQSSAHRPISLYSAADVRSTRKYGGLCVCVCVV
jgi:hypothetical protein